MGFAGVFWSFVGFDLNNIVRIRFELMFPDSKSRRLDRYPTGLLFLNFISHPIYSF